MAESKPPPPTPPSSLSPTATTAPRLIIHGGAGHITRGNLPAESWKAYRGALLHALRSTQALLCNGSSAIEAAVQAVRILEDNPLFNAGRGAVFTRAGTTELEASVMVSRGKNKRGGSVMLLRHVKNPILLAAEMLVRGDALDGKGGGAYGHCQLSGLQAERLAVEWGLELVPTEYFWTRKRWEEHLRGLEKEREGGGGGAGEEEYLPQGTVGAVAMDSWGTLCVATSTGGMTNKLPGRIGDTPTFGAGFWAEEWEDLSRPVVYRQPAMIVSHGLLHIAKGMIADCIPSLSGIRAEYYTPLAGEESKNTSPLRQRRAVALSGTGNGDTFLRLCACHTVSTIARFSSGPPRSLQSAVTQIAGPGGEMEKSAGNRWDRMGGEGQAGIIGIEVVDDGRGGIQGKVVADFNCGGMFRAWVDDVGLERCMVFRGEF